LKRCRWSTTALVALVLLLAYALPAWALKPGAPTPAPTKAAFPVQGAVEVEGDAALPAARPGRPSSCA